MANYAAIFQATSDPLVTKPTHNAEDNSCLVEILTWLVFPFHLSATLWEVKVKCLTLQFLCIFSRENQEALIWERGKRRVTLVNKPHSILYPRTLHVLRTLVDEMNCTVGGNLSQWQGKHSMKHRASQNLLPLSACHFYVIIICKTEHSSALCRIWTWLPEVSAHSPLTRAGLFRKRLAGSAEVHTCAEKRFEPRACFSTIHGEKAHSPSYLSGARTPAPEQRDPSARDGGGARSAGETLRKGARRRREGTRAGRARPGLAAAAPGWGCAGRPEARALLTEVQELLHGERGWREARVEVHLAGNAAFGRRAGARVRGEAAADARAGGAQPGARAGRGGYAKQPR